MSKYVWLDDEDRVQLFGDYIPGEQDDYVHFACRKITMDEWRELSDYIQEDDPSTHNPVWPLQ